MMVPEREVMEQWETEPAAYEGNDAPKTDAGGNAVLGLPRMF